MAEPEPGSSYSLDSLEEGEPEVQPELVASAPVLLTPVGIILVIIGVIVAVYFASRLRGKRSYYERRQRSMYEIPLLMRDDVKTTADVKTSDDVKTRDDMEETPEEGTGSKFTYHSTIITDQDIRVVQELEKFFSHPLSLVKIILPAIISIALSPLVLMCHDPIVLYFWEGESRDINSAIACFLSPAGLVYAVNFGFTFQSVLEKQRNILSTVSFEVGLLDQILELTHTFKTLSSDQKQEIYQIVKRNALCILREINEAISPRPMKELPEYRRDKIWRIVRILNERSKYLRETETILTDKIVANLQSLVSLASTRKMHLSFRIHWLQWAFLELLGFFSFFGIMLIDASSVEVELIMCVITVLSITVLCYIIADMDSPFSGYFRIDLSLVWNLVEKTSNLAKEEQEKQIDAINRGSDNEVSETDTRDDNIGLSLIY